MDGDIVILNSETITSRGASPGRLWVPPRNHAEGFKRFALRPIFSASSSWRALFRMPFFTLVTAGIGGNIVRSVTNFRKPISADVKVAAYLMYTGNATCQSVTSQLGIGPSSVSSIVTEVSREICSHFQDSVHFPTGETELVSITKGLEEIAGLSYYCGAVDGSHIRWLACPDEQFYEYRCYKGYPSIVPFAVSTADRKFIYVDVGRPGVLDDSSIYTRSSLKRNIDNNIWLGDDVPSLHIAGVPVRPDIIGDCAFFLDIHMMKSCSEAEMNASPILRTWSSMASSTRKPIECSFGVLKDCFSTLKNGHRTRCTSHT